MVICVEQGADLHMAQRISLPLTVSCFSKIQIGFTFLVPAHTGSPGQRAVKRVCVCVCVRALLCNAAADGFVQQRPGAVVAAAGDESGDQSGRGDARLLHVAQSDLRILAVGHRHRRADRHARSRNNNK